MDFALKVGIAAITTGVTLFAAHNLQEISGKWEGRIIFYDYNVYKSNNVENIFKTDNGQIVEQFIFYKYASGSVSLSLVDVLPLDHLAIVFKTDRDDYWSMEKNSKVIHIQKSQNLDHLLNKMGGTHRSSPLKFDKDKHSQYLLDWNIDDRKYLNVIKKKVYFNEVVRFVIEKEISIPFTILNNCQDFIQRILTYVNCEIHTNATFYDYQSNNFFTLFEIIRNVSGYVSEVKWLYASQSHVNNNICIGFLMKTNDGSFWSLENVSGCLSMQHSHTENSAMKMINGQNRFTELFQLNGGYNMSRFKPSTSDKAIKNNSRKLLLNDVLKVVRNKSSPGTGSQALIEEILRSIYCISDQRSASVKLFDHFKNFYVTAFEVFIQISDKVVISDVTFWSKLVDNNAGLKSSISVFNSFVLMLEASDHRFWTIERVNNTTHIQVSTEKYDLIRMIDSFIRIKPLELLSFVKKKSFEKPVIIKGLFEFLLELHREFQADECYDSVKCSLDYLGLLD